MNKIDEHTDRLVHTPEKVVDASPLVTTSEADSRPMSAGAESSQASIERMASRRMWLRRGVAVASPVVASLVSAPVYACVNVNMSGFVSQNTFNSRHPNETVCTFLGPNSWYRTLSISAKTSSIVQTKDVPFQSIFGANVEKNINNAKLTLSQVLIGGSKYSELAKYCIAAYLNASLPTANFPLTAEQAKDIYHSFYPGTVKSPPLLAKWSEDYTVGWLRMLMPN